MPAFWTGLSGTESRWSHWLVPEQVVSCTNFLPYKAEIIVTSNRPFRAEKPQKKFYLSHDTITGIVTVITLTNYPTTYGNQTALIMNHITGHRRRKFSRRSRSVRSWKRLHWDDVIFVRNGMYFFKRYNVTFIFVQLKIVYGAIICCKPSVSRGQPYRPTIIMTTKKLKC